jgi:hypothetical protein
MPRRSSSRRRSSRSPRSRSTPAAFSAAGTESILREGFRDGYYVLGIGEFRGVWVSADWPLDENEGAHGPLSGGGVLAVEIPDELFIEHEWVEEGKTYREAMIPAADLNQYPVRRLSQDEEDALTQLRWESTGGQGKAATSSEGAGR